ncbi:hypothetical protein OSB04_029244 [Centaurea solstitialis]|uniref:Jacalin-type lectin domain-containing protein n=1 Tax=Centaurea solstitialis TaxID=347529 RepID=A0AA38T216_9ASTR|nr:hypothetical protein OSB04_029244 [Centaurea solstitialis]
MENMLKLGPKWKNGSPWDEGGNTEIVQILISYDKAKIKSIQFVYADKPTGVRLSPVYGEPTGSYFKSVLFDYPSEYLTSMSGVCYDNYVCNGITASIAFGTNIRKYGPFGMSPRYCSSEFNYEFGARGFGGFHGTAKKSCLGSIGIYVKPIQKLKNNR